MDAHCTLNLQREKLPDAVASKNILGRVRTQLAG